MADDLNDFVASESLDLGRKLSFFETLYLRSMTRGLQRPKGKDLAVFKQGHSIRIALAGHDDSLKDRYPKDGIPVLTVERSSAYPSHIVLPVLRRK